MTLPYSASLFCSDAVQQQPQQLVVGEGAVGVGGIQDGIHIVGVVFNFLGEQLGSPQEIASQELHQQAGDHHKFYPAVQVIV